MLDPSPFLLSHLSPRHLFLPWQRPCFKYFASANDNDREWASVHTDVAHPLPLAAAAPLAPHSCRAPPPGARPRPVSLSFFVSLPCICQGSGEQSSELPHHCAPHVSLCLLVVAACAQAARRGAVVGPRPGAGATGRYQAAPPSSPTSWPKLDVLPLRTASYERRVKNTCCKCMFEVFQMFHRYVVSVSYGCCKSSL